MREARISSQQFSYLVAAFNMYATMLILPSHLTKEAGPDAWLAIPLGILAGALPVALLLGLLARRHPGLGFGPLAELCLGKWLGRLVVLLVGALALFITSLVIRNVIDFSTISLLPGTPSLVIAALFTLTACYSAYAGSEVIARLAFLVYALTLLALPVMIFGTGTEIHITRIQPVLGNGVLPVLRAVLPTLGWFAEFAVLAPFAFQVSRPEKTFRSMVWGNGIAMFHLTILVALSLLVFGSSLAQKFTYPVYALSRQVALGQFLERLEIGLITIWLSGMLVKAASALWVATRCVTWCFGLPQVKWLPLVTGAAAMWTATIWRSEIEEMWFAAVHYTPYFYPLFVGLPLLMLLGSFWHSRQQKGASA